MRTLGLLLLSLISLGATSFLIPEVQITNFLSAAIAALVISIINTFLKPILQFLALPISILTLGLFALVLNGLLFMLAAWIVPGFSVGNFWWAILASVVYSIIMTFLSSVLYD